MNCSYCGRELEEGATYCTRSGTPVSDEDLKQMEAKKQEAERLKLEEEKKERRRKEQAQREEAKRAAQKEKAQVAQEQKAAKTVNVTGRRKNPLRFLIPLVLVFCAIGLLKSNLDKAKNKSTDATETNRENAYTASEETNEESSEETAEEETAVYKHSYAVFPEDITWEEAVEQCEEKGGYLATITSEEEYEQICELAEASGLTYLWIGGYMDMDSQSACWITGESWSYANWYPGEPSWEDTDGTQEYCLCLWNVEYDGEDIGWTFNDQRNDLVGPFPNLSGKVGYVFEYETEVSE